MPIRYWEPVEDALRRTRAFLFRPFDLVRWLVLGFTAWLIHLGEFGGSAAGSDPEVRTHVSAGDWDSAGESLADAAANALPSGLALAAIMILVTALLLVALVLMWVSCRARFVWLENLTSGDHAFGHHWSRFGGLGDGFFLWKLAFYAVSLLLVVPLVFFGGVFGVLGVAGFDGPGSVAGWVLLGIAAFMVVVILAYVDFFAESYVTVIMHRRRIGVLAAWREFRSLFEAHPGHFVLVGLMKLVLTVITGVVLTTLGILTCCVGLVLMALPYVGAVVKLPAFMALRYFDLCWLGQFDPDLALPATATVSPVAPTPDSDPTP